MSSNRFSILQHMGNFPDIYEPKRKKPSQGSRIYTGIANNEKFLIVQHATKGKLSDLSVFAIQKAFEGITKDIVSIRALRSGDLLVVTKNDPATRALKKATTLAGLADIKVEEHPFLNSTKGIIFCKQLQNMPENEITQNLSHQKVTHTQRIMRREDGKLVPTAGLILTFNSTTLPETVKAGYLVLNVRMYIPNPLRCIICQKFGHTKKNCGGYAKCYNCSEIASDSHENPCKMTPKCANCTQNHHASSKECPVYKAEYAISQIKTADRIPYYKAKEKYIDLMKSQQIQNQLYSTVTKTDTTAEQNHTNITVPEDNNYKDIEKNNNENKGNSKSSISSTKTQNKKQNKKKTDTITSNPINDTSCKMNHNNIKQTNQDTNENMEVPTTSKNITDSQHESMDYTNEPNEIFTQPQQTTAYKYLNENEIAILSQNEF